jgi:hypothetical protein
MHASHHGNNTLVGLAHQMILFIENAENFQIFLFFSKKIKKLKEDVGSFEILEFFFCQNEILKNK